MSDLLDEIYDYLERPQRYDRYIMALCLWHDDHRPSLAIYSDSYHCAACGKRGKTADLLNELKQRGSRFIEKKQTDFRSPWSRWIKTYGSLHNVVSHTHSNLIRNNKTVYLQRRGINLATIKKLRLGWMEDWITFPFYDCNNNIIGATARAGETNKSQAKYCNVPGQDPDLLYVPSWELVEESRCVWLVYGIIDAISLYQLNVAAISTTTGKKTDPSCLESIRKTIYIIPDRGEEIEASLLSARLGWRGKAIKVDWPDGSKDCNDLYRNQKDLLIEILEKYNL